MTNFSKGPWIVKQEPGGPILICGPMDDKGVRKIIAAIFPDNNLDDKLKGVSEANARLISKAPELLDAADAVTSGLRFPRPAREAIEMIQHLEDVVAEARGEEV